MKKITLQTFSLNTCEHWLDNADRWTQVVETETGKPLWEFRRGSCFIFENAQMPRLGWEKFGAMSLEKKLAFLAQSVVSVLTECEDDAFLVRLPE